MPTISLTISKEKLDDLALAFSANGKLTDDELQEVVAVALDEWSNTLLGATRFRSITELYVNWLRDVFQRLLENEYPDERTLITRLNLPYGQAAYISRVLREENTVLSRKRWLVSLEKILKDRLADVQAWMKDGRGEEEMEFYMHKNARRELSFILGRMLEAGIPTRRIKITSIIADYVFVLICCSEVEKIINEIAEEKKRLGI